MKYILYGEYLLHRQKSPKGLGHAIHCAKSFVGNDIIYNPEYPCLKQMIDCYEEYRTTVLGVQEVEKENVVSVK